MFWKTEKGSGLNKCITTCHYSALTPSMKNLKKKGQLPGWSKEDKGAIYLEAFTYPDPRSVILTLLKRGDSSVYRYTVTRTSDSGLWRLQGARRANQKGDTLE